MKEVLILEDKSETRKVLAGLVKEVHSDAVIYEAADEKTAYDIAMKRTIDLFLVDIILHPQQHDDVSGGEFAQNIRKVDKYLFTPILIITSMYDPKMCMYSSVHCYQFIEKPFDFEKVKQIIKNICDNYDLVLKDPTPTIRVSAHSNSSIDIATLVWCKNEDYWTVKFDMLEKVKTAFDEQGIEIPFNQLDVTIKNK